MRRGWRRGWPLLDPTGAGDPFFGGYITVAPVILHVLVISQLNAFFQGIAERLAGWENHRTEGDHEDSLVLKRFFVEAFDSYIVLFYVGFFVRDPIRLCVDLVSLYTADPVRRLLLETVILATAGLCGQG